MFASRIHDRILTAAMLLCATAQGQFNGGRMVVEDEATLIQQKLGSSVAKDTVFFDEHGKKVTIGDYLDGKRPVILNLRYFSCPTLCGPIMSGLIGGLNEIDLNPGEFTVLSVSFDHREQPDLAMHKKDSMLQVYKKPGAADHWHFLTSGNQANIRRLTDSVGYGFRWNDTRKDFDHRDAMIFLSPEGKITRYLRGTSYDRQTFRLAIVEASEGKVGTSLDRFYLSCYSYDPLTGKYNRIGSTVMSIGGALTLGALATLLFVLWRGERRRQVAPAAAAS